jgi:PAS domain S-box-containing protein
MKPDKSTDAAGLRRRAEAHLRRRGTSANASQTALGTQRLLHELQVHQIELEMQNEELRNSWTAVEAGLERYTDLYDFAPVGYFTLGRNGVIVQTNLTGARLLGLERARLSGRRFGAFVSEADLPTFNSFLDQVFAAQPNQTYNLELVIKNEPQRTVQVKATLSKDGRECRAALLDITEHKQAEAALREALSALQNRFLDQTAELRLTRADLQTEKDRKT